MRKYVLPLTFVLAASLTVSAKTKLDAEAQMYVDSYNKMQQNPSVVLPLDLDSAPFEFNPKSRTAPSATVIITLADGVTADDIKAQGLTILSKAGDMVIASAPLDDIVELAETDLTKVISFGNHQASPLLYNTRKTIGMDAVHNGESGLTKGYKGSGVICGLYDTGFDALHPNFNTADQSSTRLERVWKFTSSNGLCTEYTPDNYANYTPNSNTESHGTHTAGCMVGAHNQISSATRKYRAWDEETQTLLSYDRYTKGNNPNYGMAPEATLVAATGSLYDSNILTGISNIVEYAKAQNKPAVINLSLGTTYGARDEYGTVNRYLDNLADDAIICVSAGNDGDQKLSIIKDLTSADNQVKTFFDVNTSGALGYIEVYSTDATTFKITPFIYNKATGTIEYQTDISYNSVIGTSEYASMGATMPSAFADAFQSSYLNITFDKHEATSNRYSCQILYRLTNNSTTNSRKTRQLGLMVTGNNGQRIYLTLFCSTENALSFTTNDLEGYDVATNDFTINEYACGKRVIAVGACNGSRRAYTLGNGYYAREEDTWEPGRIAYFSSAGQLYDGRRLPHVCAPGTFIISSVSSYDSDNYNTESSSGLVTTGGRNYYWAYMDGTSMSCPVVAGAIATWLEAYPQLTVEQAINVINETSVKDDLVAMDSDLRWGAGRFNALAGLKKLLGLDGVADIVADRDNILVNDKGNNVYEAFVAGMKQVNAQIYNLSGQLVASASANDDHVDIDASNLSKGVYVLKVNNYSQRILVK